MRVGKIADLHIRSLIAMIPLYNVIGTPNHTH